MRFQTAADGALVARQAVREACLAHGVGSAAVAAVATDAVVGLPVAIDPLWEEAQLLVLVLGILSPLLAVAAGVAALVEGRPYSFIFIDVYLA